MKMLKVSQCKKNLDFKPQAPWPKSLPCFSWGDQLVCDFTAPPEKFAIDLKSDETDLTSLFIDLYKSLSLAELARLIEANDRHFIFEATELNSLIEKNSLRPSESLRELFEKLVQTPLHFQNWTSDRKLGAKELFILKALTDISEVNSLLEQIAHKGPSRQFGNQILENAIELFLMSTDLNSILCRTDETCENWCLRLEKMRNPMLTSKTQEKQKDLAHLPWPKFIHARVIQSEASLENEVRLQYRNIGDFKRNIEALQKIQTEIEAQGISPK